MTQPMIPYDRLFVAASVLVVLFLGLWLSAEGWRAWKRRSRRNVRRMLKTPDPRCVPGLQDAMWISRGRRS